MGAPVARYLRQYVGRVQGQSRFGAEGLRALDRFLERAAIEIMPVDVEQARSAREAFMRFGKRRRPAGLNFGDCFSYALAKVLSEPLLFKGEDFARTDVMPVAAKGPV